MTKTLTILEKRYKTKSKNTHVFILTNGKQNNILRQFKKRIYTIQHEKCTGGFGRTYASVGRLHWYKELEQNKIICRRCERTLQIGEKIVSKPTSTPYHYCIPCAVKAYFLEEVYDTVVSSGDQAVK